MGHIVNSISTRIGWFDTWKDDIYLDFKYQCDYLHHFIRIRFLLVFLFFAKTPWDEYIIIFSHFELFKKKRLINVIIFVYLGKLIMFGTDLQLFFLRSIKSICRRRIRRNNYFNGSAMLNRLFVGFFLYFRTDYRFYRSTRRFYNRLKKKNIQN